MTLDQRQTLFARMDALEQRLEETRAILQQRKTKDHHTDTRQQTPDNTAQTQEEDDAHTTWKRRYQTLCKRHTQASLHLTHAINAIKQLLTRLDG